MNHANITSVPKDQCDNHPCHADSAHHAIHGESDSARSGVCASAIGGSGMHVSAVGVPH